MRKLVSTACIELKQHPKPLLHYDDVVDHVFDERTVLKHCHWTTATTSGRLTAHYILTAPVVQAFA